VAFHGSEACARRMTSQLPEKNVGRSHSASIAVPQPCTVFNRIGMTQDHVDNMWETEASLNKFL